MLERDFWPAAGRLITGGFFWGATPEGLLSVGTVVWNPLAKVPFELDEVPGILAVAFA